MTKKLKHKKKLKPVVQPLLRNTSEVPVERHRPRPKPQIETEVDVNDAKESPIIEYTKTQGSNKEAIVNKEIFKADDDVDVRTDVEWREITIVNSILAMNELFKRNGLSSFAKIQDDYIQQYLRLKISKERKSRAEFVAVNRQQNNIDDATALLGNLSSINNTKK